MTTNERQPAAIAVRMLDGDDVCDRRLVDQLTSLVNAVYASSESGLWRDGVSRTTASELAELIRAGEIALATRDDRVAGSVRIHALADDLGELGMLAADPAERGTGVGSALVEFAEQRGRTRGQRAIRLELLVPRGRRHPSKEFLAAWYGRIGYRRVRTQAIEDAYPHLAPLLATPCDLATFEKSLSG